MKCLHSVTVILFSLVILPYVSWGLVHVLWLGRLIINPLELVWLIKERQVVRGIGSPPNVM